MIELNLTDPLLSFWTHNDVVCIALPSNRPYQGQVAQENKFKQRNRIKWEDDCNDLFYKEFTNTNHISKSFELPWIWYVSAAKHIYKHMNLPNEPNDSATPKPFLDFFLKGVKRTTVFYRKLTLPKVQYQLSKRRTQWREVNLSGIASVYF